MTFSKFSSLPLVFLALCASFSDCASPSPSFPLTLPLMVIYLVGKGFAFSPERSTTGRRQEKENTKKRRPQKKKEGERRSGHKWEKRTENLSLVSVSPVTPTLPPTLPHSCNGSEGLATDSEGREKRITCQYLFPPAAWIETDTLHSLSRFPPKANSRALPLFGINRTSGSRLGESRHGKIVNEDTEERYEFRAKRVRE